MNELITYLSSLAAGQAIDVSTLNCLLYSSWDEFSGSDAEGTTGYKVQGRMEKIAWEPPILSFQIERHGGTVLGSTRADLHTWTWTK